jgi:hypothetical protein
MNSGESSLCLMNTHVMVLVNPPLDNPASVSSHNVSSGFSFLNCRALQLDQPTSWHTFTSSTVCRAKMSGLRNVLAM